MVLSTLSGIRTSVGNWSPITITSPRKPILLSCNAAAPPIPALYRDNAKTVDTTGDFPFAREIVRKHERSSVARPSSAISLSCTPYAASPTAGRLA
eukprot:scaffold12890_cov52-Attheya_sp.AAC.1